MIESDIPDALLNAKMLETLRTRQPVSKFHSEVEALDLLAEGRTFTERTGQQLREARSLSAFCSTLNLAECRLCINDPPDGEAWDQKGRRMRIEITEALTPGRPRSAQYRKESDPKHRPMAREASHDDLEHVKENWKRWLIAAIEKKLIKHGSRNYTDLLVEKNICWQIEEANVADLNFLKSSVEGLLPGKHKPNVWFQSSLGLKQIWPEVNTYQIPGKSE